MPLALSRAPKSLRGLVTQGKPHETEISWRNISYKRDPASLIDNRRASPMELSMGPNFTPPGLHLPLIQSQIPQFAEAMTGFDERQAGLCSLLVFILAYVQNFNPLSRHRL